MANGINVDDLDRRVRRAAYQDGLLELFAAVVLLVIAGAWIANPSFVGILAAFIVLYGWKGVERVKQRVTYPRIGYYQERSDEPRSSAKGMLWFLAGSIAIMVIAVLVGGDISDPAEWRRAAPLLAGASLSGGFWYAAHQSGFVRFRFIAALSVVSGALLWLFGSGEDYAGVVWHLVILAVPLAAIGFWALARFLRSHPVQSADE